ncbi:hypothetical protein DYB25_006370 [Aphanomyces astaci]|uniref:Uncharacterized protein n=1 Tax=Aphanomyces astaci TaxID=112090 RepID=A0A397BRL2_APHAT|nr:hypothetical protein DYB25_006370 [Aphanomyces astaci]RHY38060.1 hypothetical protein DYB38_002981 [Aphanomyces astaci]RHY45900.1 hypothetical protein DYB30_001730 [Aphanomyces astaci]RHY68914.1 hypothetical protein DYB34_013929 [Aphanomyces astaci]RHY99774.1 hypothetical protein DYB31_014917 [Aphanomyces astaci]
MSESPMHPLTDIKFSTGVWGYCVNTEYNTGVNLSSHVVDTCFSFYSAGRIVLNTTTNTPHLRQNDDVAGRSVCDVLRSSSEPIDIDLTPFVSVTGVDAAAFRSFLVLSCGSVGKSSFALSMLSVLFGTVAFLGSIALVTCCPSKSCLVSFTKAASLGAALFSLVAFSCWLAQTRPLNKVGVHPGSCFVVQIIACITFLGANMALNHHATSQSLVPKSIE